MRRIKARILPHGDRRTWQQDAEMAIQFIMLFDISDVYSKKDTRDTDSN